MSFLSENLVIDRGTVNSNTQQLGPAIHKYWNFEDNLATILASGYFDLAVEGSPALGAINAPTLAQGDIILVNALDKVEFIEVISNIGVTPVITQALTGGAPSTLDLTSGHIYVGTPSNQAADVAMSGDVTIASGGATTISNNAVTLAKLAPGITPGFVVKFAGVKQTTGGASTEIFTETGALLTDTILVTLSAPGAVPVTVNYSFINADNQFTVEFSADPSNDHVVSYMICRAAA